MHRALHYLKENGVMAIILSHGVLFRGGAEERIRTKLLRDWHMDTLISLPATLYYHTGIPVCILVLKKCKKPDDVLHIYDSEGFVKGKRQNQLSQAHIKRIIDTYQNRDKADKKYSRRVAMAKIEANNDFNLNISRYVSTVQAELEIDLAEIHAAKAIRAETSRHNEILRGLGLPLSS